MIENIDLPIKFDDDFGLVDSTGFPLMYCADLVNHNPSIGRVIEMRVNLHDELVEALRNALARMESDIEQIEGEWGVGRDLKTLEATGGLSEEIIKTRQILAKIDAHADGEKR
jgi:hypothetical protein